MNALKKKLNKNGGFTLVEMLIVVAIIAILVAVSIPLISASLEKTRDATDQANERAAKAEAALVLLEVDEYSGLSGDLKGTNGLVYNADDGKLVKVDDSNTDSYGKGYGKCTASGDDCTATTDRTNYHINIKYSDADGYTITWLEYITD